MTKQLHIVDVTTDSGDHFNWITDFKPSHEFMCEFLMKWEGNCASLDFYLDTLSMTVEECDVFSEEDFRVEEPVKVTQSTSKKVGDK